MALLPFLSLFFILLSLLIRSMSKDLIALCMTHYKISRSHTDNKDQLVVKIIDHFTLS